MKLIATHVNADFDGFAAMLGLLKLHPDAMLVFPGSKEPSLRHFLKETGLELPETHIRDVSKVEHLILVDAGREDRLDTVGGLLHATPRPFVEIYDHHPEEQITIPADRAHIQPYGSTTTIVVKELMALTERPRLSSMEASILLAGIYEDTANFLSTGTGEADFSAALFLLNEGAEISVVNRLLSHKLQPAQVAFFNSLVSHCEHLQVAGAGLTISAFSWHTFVPEAAYLVHRLMDLEPLRVFFALIMMDERVHLIARSQAPDIDVGVIAERLGGGGHKMAASAVLKGVTLIEAREKLLAVLNEKLQSREKAADVMKTDIISIESGKTIADVAETMNSHRINALPVVENKRVIGTISRQIVDGAVFHGLSERPITEFMVTDIPLVDPDTPVGQIFETMVSGRTRFVLVGKTPEDVQGIVTRMDLLRYHYQLESQAVNLRKGRQSENLKPMLAKRLPDDICKLLVQAGEVAEQIDSRVYLVGGVVRDLLLHRENTDVDLVVEGDGILFAEQFAGVRCCKLATHRRFGTARLICPTGFRVDIATARTESYHAPAALPQVRGGILRQDLYRRDFTINTLAIDLTPRHFGQLVDYFGGWDDIHEGVIRVLHSLSFVDDPTRALRAIRFATRFNFRISKDTQRLIQSAVQSRVLERLSGKRLWTELKHLLQEEYPIAGMRMLHQYRLLGFIHPAIALDAFLLDLLYEIQSVLSWVRLNFLQDPVREWLLYLMGLLEKLNRAERIEVAQRFQLTSDVVDILRYYKSNTRDIFSRLRTANEPGPLYLRLREYPLEVLLYTMARLHDESIRQQIALFLRDLRNIHLEINGDDLIRLGLPAGKQVRDALDRLLATRMGGQVKTREEQLQLAEKLIAEWKQRQQPG